MKELETSKDEEGEQRDAAKALRLYVVCDAKYVKTVKTWLESQNGLFKGEKIVADGDMSEPTGSSK